MGQNTTVATVDSEVTKRMALTKEALKDVAACTVAYSTLGCDKPKSGADCAWACAYYSKEMDEFFGCNNNDTKCNVNNGAKLLSCESMSAMFTAVCNKTAAEIEVLVAKGKSDGKCANKADGGVDFSPPSVVPIAGVQNNAASGGLSPMWSLGIAVCLVSAAASTLRL